MPLRVIRVLAITASPKVRHLLNYALKFSHTASLVGLVNSAQEALELSSVQPDVILLDVAIRDLDGVAAIRALCFEFLDAEIIALIGFLEGITQEQAIKAGALSTLPRNSLSDPMLRWAIVLAHNGLRYRLPALVNPMAPLEYLHLLEVDDHEL
jgi:two-component system NarL family response regulator